MAQEPLVQHKIGFTRTEIGEIRKWQNERGLNSLSAAVRALTISALGGSAEVAAARIGEAGMVLNDLVRIADGRKTAISKRQVEELVQRHRNALMGLRPIG